jgi:hypothetical protein
MNSFIGACVGAAVGVLLVSVAISAQCLVGIRDDVRYMKRDVSATAHMVAMIMDKLESNCEEEIK